MASWIALSTPFSSSSLSGRMKAGAATGAMPEVRLGARPAHKLGNQRTHPGRVKVARNNMMDRGAALASARQREGALGRPHRQ